MSQRATHDVITEDDGHLVDVVRAALVDPNLHTDTRMRLHWEMRKILHNAREETHGAAAAGAAPAHPDEPVADLLTSVLVDPNLHTDTRMRLHREIHDLLIGAGHLSGEPTQTS